jgi:hypothetical protein
MKIDLSKLKYVSLIGNVTIATTNDGDKFQIDSFPKWIYLTHDEGIAFPPLGQTVQVKLEQDDDGDWVCEGWTEIA